MIKRKTGNSRDQALNSVMQLFADDMTATGEQQLGESRRSDGEFEQAFMETAHALAE